jgi:hypothetical protein
MFPGAKFRRILRSLQVDLTPAKHCICFTENIEKCLSFAELDLRIFIGNFTATGAMKDQGDEMAFSTYREAQ